VTETEARQAHTINDLALALGALRRSRGHATTLLADAQHALAAGHHDVAAELVARALDYLGA
jgi:hypothetical protein